MKKNTYLFDFDGTLVDSMPYFISLMLRILDENNIPYGSDIVKIITPLGYKGTAEYFRSLGVKADEDAIISKMQEYALEDYTNSIPAKPGVVSTLSALKKAGASLNILTASPHSALDPCLKRLGLFELFDNVWSSDDFGMTKSDPNIYLAAAEKLQKKPSEVIFVDDNVIAVRTAKEAGMIPYGIFDESSAELRNEMISVSERYLDTFSEILLDVDCEDKKSALFIGNSYTFFNDMPTILETLAHENGYPLQVDSVTKGGRKLYANLEKTDEYNAKILNLTSKNRYDALFLQEQSYFALVDYDKFLFGLSELIKLVDAKKVILYATWGRKAGAPLLEDLKLTSEEMTDALTKAYISASKTLNTEISHVGSAFLSLSKSHPEVELYNKDKSHPSYLGSVLAAISHYNAFFAQMPKKHNTLNISDELFSLFVKTVQEIGYES